MKIFEVVVPPLLLVDKPQSCQTVVWSCWSSRRWNLQIFHLCLASDVVLGMGSFSVDQWEWGIFYSFLVSFLFLLIIVWIVCLFLNLIIVLHWFLSYLYAVYNSAVLYLSHFLSLFLSVLPWPYTSVSYHGILLCLDFSLVFIGATSSRVLNIWSFRWNMASSRVVALSTGWLLNWSRNLFIASSVIFLNLTSCLLFFGFFQRVVCILFFDLTCIFQVYRFFICILQPCLCDYSYI